MSGVANEHTMGFFCCSRRMLIQETRRIESNRIMSLRVLQQGDSRTRDKCVATNVSICVYVCVLLINMPLKITCLKPQSRC